MTESKENQSIIIRADGSARIGIGHVMRCLALAQALRRNGFTPAFIMKRYDDVAGEILARYQFAPIFLPDGIDETQDAVAVRKIVEERGAELVILDNYDLGEPFRVAIRRAGCPLLVIDDLAEAGMVSANVILNQNVGASVLVDRYHHIAPDAGIFLLGEKYSMFREDILEKGERARRERKARLDELAHSGRKPDVLITFGGSDVRGLTPLAMEQLKVFHELYHEVYVACGPGISGGRLREHICTIARDIPRMSFLSQPDLSELMGTVDIAITAGGSTAQELAYFGVAMIIIQVAENQRIICGGFQDKHLAKVLDMESRLEENLSSAIGSLLQNPDEIKAFAEGGMRTFDGDGCTRIIHALMGKWLSGEQAQSD